MAFKRETITIAGHKYDVGQLPYREGLDTLELLTRTLGPALAALLADAGDRAVSVDDIKGSAVGALIGELSKALTAADVDRLIEVYGAQTLVDGKPLDAATRELVFAGQWRAMFDYLIFCTKLNYADFIEGLAGSRGVGQAHPQG